MTLSNGPTLGIEPTAYCWFAHDASASNIGGQEEKCLSPLRTRKFLLIANVTTLSHGCKPRIRTSAWGARNSEKDINFTWFELVRGFELSIDNGRLAVHVAESFFFFSIPFLLPSRQVDNTIDFL